MKDTDLLRRIEDLMHEEDTLRAGGGLDDAGMGRLHALEVGLDQCWDLLAQRRARRAFGQDPDQATLRAEEVVEGYVP